MNDPDEIGFEETCVKCGADLHCCRNCTFFDTSADNECRQSVQQRIAKKRANNECPLFEPVQVVDLKGAEAGRPIEDARAAFDALFKF